MKFQGRITEAQQKELSLKLEEAFKNPQVKSWFSKTWTKVYTESALLTLEGAIRIPDRVLSNENDTVVIDFKFGSEHEQYKEQILEYAALLKQMGFPNVKSYLYRTHPRSSYRSCPEDRVEMPHRNLGSQTGRTA